MNYTSAELIYSLSQSIERIDDCLARNCRLASELEAFQTKAEAHSSKNRRKAETQTPFGAHRNGNIPIPENLHSAQRSAFHSEFLGPVSECSEWSERESAILNEIVGDGRIENWNEVAEKCRRKDAGFSRNGRSCQIGFEHGSLAWTTEEEKQLHGLVTEFEGTHWSKIGELMGRAPSDCFSHAYASLHPMLVPIDFTADEDALLTEIVARIGESAWSQASAELGSGHTEKQCMNRWLKTLKPGIQGGRWNPTLNSLLIAAVEVYGQGNWVQISKHVPGKTDRKCRERYMDRYQEGLRPATEWTPIEDEQLLAAVAKFGPGKWSKIKDELQGRTDHMCRVRFRRLEASSSLKERYEEELAERRSEKNARSRKYFFVLEVFDFKFSHKMKELRLFQSFIDSLGTRPLTDTQKSVLLVHAICVANGLVPDPIIPGENGFVCLLPSLDWPNTQMEELYTFKYVGGAMLKCLPLNGEKIAIHAHDDSSVQISTSMRPEQIINLVKANILRVSPPLDRRSQEVFHLAELPHRRVSPVRSPAFGQPVGPGELVGPNHPIFTGSETNNSRDPRFDPIGPGFIGEPDSDHFPPPPFGQPPTGRRPLRGPHANIGPGALFPNCQVAMESESSTDEERNLSGGGSSSSLSGMTEDEKIVLERIRARIPHSAHLLVIQEVRKPCLNQLIAIIDIFPSTDQHRATIRLVHRSRQGFHIQLVSEPSPEMDDFVAQLNQFAPACVSISTLLERCADILQQLRLTQLMDTLELDEGEEVSETRSLTSGTTAASPQSSCSTIPSVRED